MKYWHRYKSNNVNEDDIDKKSPSYNKMTLLEKRDNKKENGSSEVNRFEKGRSRFGDSDIDIFLYGLTPVEATKKLIDLTEQIRRAGADPALNPYLPGTDNAPEILAVRTENAITYITTPMHPHLQIILRIYGAPSEILMGFDVDSCCVGFDGTDAWALPRARRAIKYSANIADPARESRTYEIR